VSLAAMRLRGAVNGLRRSPVRLVVGVVLLAGVFDGVLTVTRRGVRFLDGYPGIGTIAGAVEQRSLEALFTVLMLAVAFSVLTGAIATLYGSQDLPFLLSLPVDPVRVFTLKVVETYLNSALLPALFTLPVLVGLGLEQRAPAGYYAIAIFALLALYALPVALGAVAALLLMRVAPAGRAKEVATAASVALAAGLVLGMRALRPERLQHLTPAQFEQALSRFADLHVGWLPSAWGSAAVWGALQGRVPDAALLLALVSLVVLLGVARLAAMAYRAGWFRSLDTQGRQGAVGALPPARWERPLARLGPAGGMVIKDLRLLARDPSQWSQLLVLVALAGVYFISTASLAAEMQSFRDVVGALNLVFLGFLLAGVGIRTAFPLVSLEGEGLWLLRTGPLRARNIVAAKFWGALPPMLLLGGGLGVAVAGRLGVSPVLALATPVAGVCAAVAVTGLGVGLGAAFPRLDAASPTEVPLSLGGLIYMALSLAYAVVTTLLFAYPTYRSLRAPGAFQWDSALGLTLLAAVLAVTLLWTLLPLAFGSARLARLESNVG